MKNHRRSRSPWRSAVEALEHRLLLAAGDLDTTFSGNGKAAASFSPGNDYAGDVLVQQDDGKIIVVGTAKTEPLGLPALGMIRYMPDGTPDPTFGTSGDGKVVTPLGPADKPSYAYGAALQSDGKIVVVGQVDNGDLDQGAAVARFMPDGSFDNSFEGNGRFVLYFSLGTGYGPVLRDVAIQKDGNIVVAGSMVTGSIFVNSDFLIMRLTHDGQMDLTFGDDNGIRFAGFDKWEEGTAVTIDYTGTAATNPRYGTIVVVGYGGDNYGRDSRQMAIARLTPGGDFDNTFDDNGRMWALPAGAIESNAQGVVIQPGGKIVVAGAADYSVFEDRDFALSRYLPDGTADTSFGPDGTGHVRTDLGGEDGAMEIIYGSTGELLVGGFSGDKFGIACYTSNGILDPHFAGNGKLATDMPSPAAAMGLALAPNNTFVAAGTMSVPDPYEDIFPGGSTGNDFYVARYHDRAPIVSLTSLDTAAAEAGPNSAVWFASRDGFYSFTTRVYYAVTGTASAPGTLPVTARDFDGVPTTPSQRYVDIFPGQNTSDPVFITPIDDTRPESDETAIFTISPFTAYENGAAAKITVTIADNDRQISGNVFNDTNSNSVFDGTETGMSGWKVYVDSNNNNAMDSGEPNTTTGVNGTYQLGNLGTGTFILRQVGQSGYRRTLPAPPANSYTFTLAAGQKVVKNFADTTNILLSGTVFNDANSNGAKDASESGIPGVVVNIFAGTTVVASRTTDATGLWLVKGLPAGAGQVKAVIPGGYVATVPAGAVFNGTATSGQQIININFGLHKIAPAPAAEDRSLLPLLVNRYHVIELLADVAAG